MGPVSSGDMDMYSFVSSAKLWKLMPCLMPDDIPQGKHLKRIGPKFDPWGTPHRMLCVLEEQVSMLTKKRRSVRQERNQLRTVPERPTRFPSLSNKLWWSTVSKAALKSNKKGPHHYCFKGSRENPRLQRVFNNTSNLLLKEPI